jgi:hypothetical protein
MNDTIFLEAARKLAERMMAQETSRRLDWGVRLVTGRASRPQEIAVLEKSLERFRQEYRERPQDAEKYLAQGESPRDPKLDAAELAAYATVASLLLNLDETVTRP